VEVTILLESDDDQFGHTCLVATENLVRADAIEVADAERSAQFAMASVLLL
jgi:hypothetical protein